MDTKEFLRDEIMYGGRLELTRTFRVSRILSGHITSEATEQKVDPSVLMRHAIYEYLERKGRKPSLPTGF